MLQTVSDQSGKPNSNTKTSDMVAFFVLYLVIFGLLFGGHVSFKSPNSIKSTTTAIGKSTMLKCVSGVLRSFIFSSLHTSSAVKSQVSFCYISVAILSPHAFHVRAHSFIFKIEKSSAVYCSC